VAYEGIQSVSSLALSFGSKYLTFLLLQIFQSIYVTVTLQEISEIPWSAFAEQSILLIQKV